MIVDLLAGFVLGIANALLTSLQSLWTHVDPGYDQMGMTQQFFARSNDWFPVGNLAAMMAVMLSILTFTVFLKFLLKIVDWLPFH